MISTISTKNYTTSSLQTARLLFRKITRRDFNLWLPFFEDPEEAAHWKAMRENPEAGCKKWYAHQLYRERAGTRSMCVLIEKKSDKNKSTS